MGRERIPEHIQRQVRQHCGFGCAICGDMPTHIEHIIPYAVEKAHRFENLVLLCTKHHQEVTSGRLSKTEVVRARKQPYSIRNKASYQPLLSAQSYVDFGTLRFLVESNTPLRPFSIKDKFPIEIELGKRPKFSFVLSGRTGEDAVRVTENNFAFFPRNLWDVRLSGQQLLVKYGQNKILLKAKIENGNINFISIRMAVENLPVIADQNGIHFPNSGNTLSDFSMKAKSVDSFISAGSNCDSMIAMPFRPSASPQEAWEIAHNYKSKKIS